MGRDLLYALRAFRNAPGFTLIVIASLALGIGANTAVFTLLDQAILQNLKVTAPEQLALLHVERMELNGSSSSDNGHGSVFSVDMLRRLRAARAAGVQDIAARGARQQAVLAGDKQENVDVELVSGNYFQLLGVNAMIGRTITEEDDRAEGASPVVVLPWGTWQDRYNGDPRIVGQSIRLNGLPFTVVGVLPPHFYSLLRGQKPKVIVPIAMQKAISPDFPGFAKDVRWLNPIARLAPGVTRRQAADALQPVWISLFEELGGKKDRKPQNALRLTDGSGGINDAAQNLRVPLLVLMGTTGVVLLIACVNIAGLLLARAAGRQREIAIRLSLGATRMRLMRQTLAESLLLSAAGAVAGLLLASWMTVGLLQLTGNDPADSTFGWQWDWRVLTFAAGLCLLTTALFGLAPAFHGMGGALARALHNRSLPRGHAAVRKIMVGAQIGLATLLLFSAGLFARSLRNLMSVDPGFRTERVVQFDLAPRQAGYDHPRGQQLYLSLLERLRTLPGAVDAGGSSPSPMSGNTRSGNVTVAGFRPAPGQDAGSRFHSALPGFFRTIGVPLVAGREILESDAAGSPKVAVVNEAFARKYCDGNALGRKVALGGGNKVVPDIEIVGVIRDIRTDLRQPAEPSMYLPHAQEKFLQRITFYVRTSGEEKAAMNAVREAVRSLDPNLPLDNVETMAGVVGRSVRMDRLMAILCTAFAGVAILLTAIGVYGVIAWTVTRRTSEIAIRMALGAMPGRVLGMVFGEIAAVAAAGIAAGALLALSTGQFAESKLYGVPGRDPAMMTLAILTSALVAAAATAFPAWRATRIQPADALRSE